MPGTQLPLSGIPKSVAMLKAGWMNEGSISNEFAMPCMHTHA